MVQRMTCVRCGRERSERQMKQAVIVHTRGPVWNEYNIFESVDAWVCNAKTSCKNIAKQQRKVQNEPQR